MGGSKSSLGFLVLLLIVLFSGTSSDPRSQVFLSYDCGTGKIKYMSPLGEEVKSMNAWETQTDTLRDTGDLLKEQMPDVTPEKHLDKASPTTGPSTMQPTAPESSYIAWIATGDLAGLVIIIVLACVHDKKRRRCSQEARQGTSPTQGLSLRLLCLLH
ncbi:uncharacterized protein LOC129620144 isoform X3 [Bubalus kerabau]|uniref:uncharacterized protein LOC129620144 isoform X3 n=1 Tax=Bubalus carabanensis TaxID=3119969 RepID=UPI00244E924A|nr:uncharacterized protein LOC129620144 isoform X3 [Bubalus carabanensis]